MWFSKTKSDPKPTILIIGFGFVGKVICASLSGAGYKVETLDRFDPLTDRMKEAESIIICVDTPTVNGKCDDSNVHEALAFIKENYYPGIPVMLKSTVTPDLVDAYPYNVTVSPEFLRESHAEEDFANQKFMFLGADHGKCEYWIGIFKYLKIEFHKVDSQTAAIVKYIHNTWLATKVAYFHELLLAANDGAFDYNAFHRAIDIIKISDPAVGKTHMDSPGLGNPLGFGGKCLPKDIEAFATVTDSEILKAVIKTNERLRNEQIR